MKELSKFFLIGNMKMNPINREEMTMYEKSLKEELQRLSSHQVKRLVEISLAPPFLYIKSLSQSVSGVVNVGSQDVSSYQKGSYTGDISASMIYSEGASFSLIGHSERRKYHKEGNEDIARKVRNVLDFGMRVVLCVGESQEEHSMNKTDEVIKKQLQECLFEVKENEVSHVYIVYEPVWAVGSDETPTSLEIGSVKKGIQNVLTELFQEKGDEMKILYGGSVHAHNLLETCIIPGMDGALVGRSSLDPKEFFEIVFQAKVL
ncbi:MAG: triose-phosphate isomerase [Candidatus Moranbacteria bacterium]|nr:triose-phosphate isomerase [Candidatus Moranbacteria bacterium]